MFVVFENGGKQYKVFEGDTLKIEYCECKKGDILKPAGWNKPATNSARGNVLDGMYQINWTGPMYLS